MVPTAIGSADFVRDPATPVAFKRTLVRAERAFPFALTKPDGSFTVGKSISRREDEPRSYRGCQRCRYV